MITKLFMVILLLKAIPLYTQDASILYKNTVNSTVTIETDISLGSGFFIKEDLIVTNYHVVKDGKEVYFYTNDYSQKNKIIGYTSIDRTTDLILLRVSGFKNEPIKISSNSIFPGEKVYVFGSPKGLPATISDGIVSGIREFEGNKLIQITAPISAGSSGGPVLNINGELVGVAVAQISEGQNLNFAIPKIYLEALLNKQTTIPIPIIELYNELNSFIDSRDGMKYQTIKIGEQIWMAENLKATCLNDGTPIKLMKDNLVWNNSITAGYCWYKNDSNSFDNTYGAIYNWFSVKTGKLCPVGWHIPNKVEWELLIEYISKNHNNFGFNYNHGGFRSNDGVFDAAKAGGWWTSSLFSPQGIDSYLYIYYCLDSFFISLAGQNSGHSVRCIKD